MFVLPLAGATQKDFCRMPRVHAREGVISIVSILIIICHFQYFS